MTYCDGSKLVPNVPRSISGNILAVTGEIGFPESTGVLMAERPFSYSVL